METLMGNADQQRYMGETQSPTMPRERDEKGRIAESYPLEDVHAALNRIGPAGTQEVADELGCAYATAYEKLRALEDEEQVSSRKVANARLWSAENDENRPQT